MRFRNIVAAAAAVSLIATPTLAAGDAAAAPEVAPASETLGSDDQQIYGASIILQLGVVLALAVIAYFVFKALDKDDEPASP